MFQDTLKFTLRILYLCIFCISAAIVYVLTKNGLGFYKTHEFHDYVILISKFGFLALVLGFLFSLFGNAFKSMFGSKEKN